MGCRDVELRNFLIRAAVLVVADDGCSERRNFLASPRLPEFTLHSTHLVAPPAAPAPAAPAPALATPAPAAPSPVDPSPVVAFCATKGDLAKVDEFKDQLCCRLESKPWRHYLRQCPAYGLASARDLHQLLNNPAILVKIAMENGSKRPLVSLHLDISLYSVSPVAPPPAPPAPVAPSPVVTPDINVCHPLVAGERSLTCLVLFVVTAVSAKSLTRTTSFHMSVLPVRNKFVPLHSLTFCAADHISSLYSVYSNELCPLADFKSLPDDLFAVAQPNGDIGLYCSDGQESLFDVIGMIISSCLDPPPGFPKLVLLDARHTA